MKNLKMYVLLLFVQFFLFVPKAEATMPTFDTTAMIKKAYDMIEQNVQDGMSQWAQSTMQNGSNAAMADVRECMNFDISSVLGSLGGLGIELPCGTVWEIDNPADQIAQQAFNDLKATFFKQPFDAFIKWTQQWFNLEERFCNFSATQSWSDVYDYEALMQVSKDRLGNIYDCKKEAAKTPTDRHLDKDIVNDIFTDKANKGNLGNTSPSRNYEEVKKITDGTNKSAVTNRTITEKKEILRRVLYTNEYNKLLDYSDSLTDNEIELLKNANLIRQDIPDAEKRKEFQKMKIAREYAPYTRIPISIMQYVPYKEGGGGSGSTTAIFGTHWKDKGVSPSLTLKYISPFEIFDKFETVNFASPSKGFVDNYSLNESRDLDLNIGIKDNKIKVKDYLELKDNLTGSFDKSNPKVTAGNKTVDKFEQMWKFQLYTSLLKYEDNKVLPYKFTHTNSMKFLVESTELISAEIENFGSTNGNAMLTNVYLKSNLYSQAIIVDLLEKQLISQSQINESPFEDGVFKNKEEIYLHGIHQLLTKFVVDQGFAAAKK